MRRSFGLLLIALLFLAGPASARLTEYEARAWLVKQRATLVENYEKIIVTTMKVEGVGGIGISLPYLGYVSGVKTFGFMMNDGALYESGLLYTQCAIMTVKGKNIVLLGPSYAEIVNGILK